MTFFASHHGPVNESEQGQKSDAQRGRAARNCEAQTHQEAAQVKGAARVRIRAGDRQTPVLVEMPRGPGANREAEQGDRGAGPEKPRRGLGKDQVGDAQRESERHARPRSPIVVATAHTLSTSVREWQRAPTRRTPREDRAGSWSAGCDRWGHASEA